MLAAQFILESFCFLLSYRGGGGGGGRDTRDKEIILEKLQMLSRWFAVSGIVTGKDSGPRGMDLIRTLPPA